MATDERIFEAVLAWVVGHCEREGISALDREQLESLLKDYGWGIAYVPDDFEVVWQRYQQQTQTGDN